ncbi:hypothetical protein PHYBLDRAFT_58516 [Phycomyces blakesleeanus NRRL 1555(-)]|uniref:Uncharacterized protein n=1 Tax=Phycomyces blakesleeanus (strain ATCC 8743b / DSM 1359 / FGSC 10004 / NBRC 33097 / NRRL 1555) TaxID=763407 RepID=A0A167QC96_PHYB8|nr:hypothetical protein PHYBLDRAFT_58516 [Phycomyces blakesleeanus NRRL 1555(-)]OAD79467.1 hypothetical protein PHYBLDRAFT_58516 [Phycomyces blakesleeanus NRRL 1555(-)]|eukprot:XP_018297507.1 hypothetical protein PHYBLDRAFT_58516 [Phycomyces blakesleeanus NRRL 1555(-)]
MNPAGYETHVFHINITSNTTENIEQQDEDGVTTQTMQNTQTTKATTTERTDCRQSFTIYFAEVLWYCSMQELFHAQNLQRDSELSNTTNRSNRKSSRYFILSFRTARISFRTSTDTRASMNTTTSTSAITRKNISININTRSK